MSKYMDRAHELRACKEVHHNCAQSVLEPFAAPAGLTEEQCFKVAAAFGAGMKMGGTCGAITGGLMALGLLGIDGKYQAEYFRRIKEAHHGVMDCAELLRINKEEGGDKPTHCNKMVYECLALVEEFYEESRKA